MVENDLSFYSNFLLWGKTIQNAIARILRDTLRTQFTTGRCVFFKLFQYYKKMDHNYLLGSVINLKCFEWIKTWQACRRDYGDHVTITIMLNNMRDLKG